MPDCEVEKGHLGDHVLFLTFLLELSCCKGHGYCSSVLPESAQDCTCGAKLGLQHVSHDMSKPIN